MALHQTFEDLKNPSFVFVGRSHIINIDHVDRITTDAVYLEDGIKIQAGAETIQDVKTRIHGKKKYICSRIPIQTSAFRFLVHSFILHFSNIP